MESISEDLNDPKFADMASTLTFSENGHGLQSMETSNVTTLCPGNSEILVHVYPTKDTYTGDATRYTILVSFLFSISTILFIMYDSNVKRRQVKVEVKAKQTDAIVQQLFPGQLRDMVIENSSRHADDDEIDTSTEGGKQEDAAKQMADFYPEATVAMIDLSGFTAWSSTREPTQVFDLLESIFQCFDKVARRRGIFKVSGGMPFVVVATNTLQSSTCLTYYLRWRPLVTSTSQSLVFPTHEPIM